MLTLQCSYRLQKRSPLTGRFIAIQHSCFIIEITKHTLTDRNISCNSLSSHLNCLASIFPVTRPRFPLTAPNALSSLLLLWKQYDLPSLALIAQTSHVLLLTRLHTCFSLTLTNHSHTRLQPSCLSLRYS